MSNFKKIKNFPRHLFLEEPVLKRKHKTATFALLVYFYAAVVISRFLVSHMPIHAHRKFGQYRRVARRACHRVATVALRVFLCFHRKGTQSRHFAATARRLGWGHWPPE